MGNKYITNRIKTDTEMPSEAFHSLRKLQNMENVPVTSKRHSKKIHKRK